MNSLDSQMWIYNCGFMWFSIRNFLKMKCVICGTKRKFLKIYMYKKNFVYQKYQTMKKNVFIRDFGFYLVLASKHNKTTHNKLSKCWTNLNVKLGVCLWCSPDKVFLKKKNHIPFNINTNMTVYFIIGIIKYIYLIFKLALSLKHTFLALEIQIKASFSRFCPFLNP